MNKNRFFALAVIVSLAVMAALTLSQAAATHRLVSAASNDKAAASNLTISQCSAPDAERASIRTAYDAQRGAWVTYAGDVPAGVDGGLIQLLNDRRACSQ